MKKPNDPKDLAIDLLSRSTCNVKVAAVLADGVGIFAWGWNSSGPDGYGMHAEHHALTRASKARAKGATIYVAAERKRGKKQVTARPCLDCYNRIVKYDLDHIWYRDGQGKWVEL